MAVNSTSRKGFSWREPTSIALETLRTHKLRSFLTLLGVILAVSTLLIVVSLIEGTNRYFSSRIANFGANVYLVRQFPLITSFEEFVKLRKRNKKITFEEFEYVRDSMSLAKNVGFEIGRQAKLKYGNESLDDVDVRGVTANISEMDTAETELGRYISDGDNEHRADVAMIGHDVVKRFFTGVDPLGKNIMIDGKPYEVIGTAKEIGSTFGQSQDSFVYIPIQSYRKVYGTQDSGNIHIQALGPHLMQGAEDESRALLRARRHLLNSGDEDNFGILEPEALMELWKSVTGTLATVSIGIVLLFLVIGGIVIMNIMLASVTERTREIGVRKSLGATRRDILLQFMMEASVISAVGGALGIIFAFTIAEIVDRATPVPMAVPLGWVVASITISTLVGLFFGIYPAYKASRLDPIEALRAET
jgi:putative ABC transport system permease protein